MKQFRNASLVKLVYEVLGFLIANGLFPKKIDFWVDDEEKVEIVCNVYYCPNKKVKGQGPFIAKNENDIPPFGYPDVLPTMSEQMVSDEMDELTECERSYKKYLQDKQGEN